MSEHIFFSLLLCAAVSVCDAQENPRNTTDIAPSATATTSLRARLSELKRKSGEPDQVAQLLRTCVPREYAALAHGQNYDFIVRNMEAARFFFC